MTNFAGFPWSHTKLDTRSRCSALWLCWKGRDRGDHGRQGKQDIVHCGFEKRSTPPKAGEVCTENWILRKLWSSVQERTAGNGLLINAEKSP